MNSVRRSTLASALVILGFALVSCGETADEGDQQSGSSPDQAADIEVPGCSVTRAYELPSPDDPSADSRTAYADPDAAAAGFVAETLREYETNSELSEVLEIDADIWALEADRATWPSMPGNDPVAVLTAIARYETFDALQTALADGTAVSKEDGPERVTFQTPERPGANVKTVRWGDRGWQVDSFGHSIPSATCQE